MGQYVHLPDFFKKYIDMNKSYKDSEIKELFHHKSKKVKKLYNLMSSVSYCQNSVPYLMSLYEKINNKNIKVEKIFCPLSFESMRLSEKKIIVLLRLVSLLYSLQNNMSDFSEKLYSLIKMRNYFLDEYVQNINIDEISDLWSELVGVYKNLYDKHVGTACNFAIKYTQRMPLEPDDAIQICLFSLDEALNTYNYDLNTSFLTRLFVLMDTNLKRGYKTNGGMLGYEHKMWHKRIEDVYNYYQSLGLDKPTQKDLSNKLGIKENTLSYYLYTYQQELIKPSPLSKYEISITSNVNNCFSEKNEISFFLKIIENMEELTKIVLYHQFSLNNFEYLSRRDLAIKYKTTEGIIRSHLKKGLQILKEQAKGLKLEDFVDFS